MQSNNQQVQLEFPDQITLYIKREDLIHPFVSGNKFRKLKYNLQQAKNEKHNVLLTFGGAYSNHIAAVAFAGRENGFETIGIIRGDELRDKISENATLSFAQECGMRLEFVSRDAYRQRAENSYLAELEIKYDRFYLIPEGGTNEFAVQGCEEILSPSDSEFDYLCCPVGTGGTISGLINSALPHQKILGFPALKGEFLQNEICIFVQNKNWELQHDYHFGGYGKVTEEYINWINWFYRQTGIPLDPIYTGKMVYGVLDLIKKNYFPSKAKILMIHTGGLQGIAGMNTTLAQKNKPLIAL